MTPPERKVDVVELPRGEAEVLCRRRYPNHAKGCPNYGRKKGCPPTTRRIFDVLDPLAGPIFAIYNRFDLAAHVRRLKARHPGWTDGQLYCCLYWQPRARKSLRHHIAFFLWTRPGYHVVATPEALGVNVTATMQTAGIELEWPPRKVAYQVVLAGRPRTRAKP